MDLKTVNVALSSDIGNFDGSVFEMTLFLRELAIIDLIRLCETQVSYDTDVLVGGSVTYYDTPFQVNHDNAFEAMPDEEIFVEEPDVVAPQKASEILDMTFSTKVNKYASVITYFDNIIKLDGVVSISNPIPEIIGKFKELDNVYRPLGNFTYSNSTTTV